MWRILNDVTRLKVAALLVFSFSASSVAQAQVQQTGLYFGVDVMEVEFQSPGFTSAKPTAVGLATGYRLNGNFAVEARGGAGLSDAGSRFGPTPVDVSVDSFYGFYGKGILPLSDIFELYGSLGYTYVDMKARASTGSIVGSEDDFSYSIGAALKVSYSASLQVEWGRMLDGDGFRLDALLVGMRFSF